ncbi:MAG: serine/threonine-protein phosphatase [Deltaproteobacteria bacterium]|nr:serine/threonine-protein phosphatase [Deltaproteobacteria bacterium]
MTHRLESFGLSDVGKRREHNEDAFHIDGQMSFFIVADGMGGAAAGEVASAEAVEQVLGMVGRGYDKVKRFIEEPTDDNRHAVHRLLESAIQMATYMIFGLAEFDPRQKGMGTTLSALLVAGSTSFVVHVGDSRVYLIRDGRAVQLTEDHTLVNLQVSLGLITPEQAKVSRRGNVITRAVGVRDYVQVDNFELTHQGGDCFLLCSDGLSEYFDTPEEIPTLLDDNLHDSAQRCIDMANSKGGKDNITTLLVRVHAALEQANFL